MSEGLKSADNTQSKKGRLTKAFDILLVAVIAALAGVIAYTMIMSGKGRTASFFGRSVLYVATGSMEPSISEGDYIFMEDADSSELKEGDIITFVSHEKDIDGLLVTHRIVSVNADGSFVTKGDANETADEKAVLPSDIEGRYTGRARFFEMIGSFANAKKLIMLLVMIPIALVSIYEVKTLAKLMLQSRAEQKILNSEQKEQLIRERIEKEKQRLRDEAAQENGEVKQDGPTGDNEG